jgi:putative ABC transport system permease protein
MKIVLQVVLKQFMQRKLRSALTVVGILIGISSLVSLVLLSSALKDGVGAQLDNFGSDVILLAPLANLGGGGGPQGYGKFTQDDADIVETVPQVIEVLSFLSSTEQVRVGNEQIRSSIRGYQLETAFQDGSFEDFINLDLAAGRYMQKGDRYVVNLGARAATELFEKELFVGNSIEIGSRKFTIVGIFAQDGTQQNDFGIFVPQDSLRDIIGQPKAITAISARIAPGADLDIMKERITNTLEKYRGQEDFGVTTPQDIQDSIGGFISAIDVVVLSIALISLFVGALGIMNSLYTSVLQRTKEIGTMKAIGATNGQILQIFLIESALLGFIGGVLGIIIGVMLASVFIVGINSLGFVKLIFDLDWALFAFARAFSIGVGVVAGLLPAIRASRLKPVDALRYE